MTDAVLQTKARIYLAGKRGITVRAGHVTYHTLNDGAYAAVGREPFFGIRALNDEVLNARTTMHYAPKEDSLVLLLPVVGGVKFRIHAGESNFLEPDTAQFIYVAKDAVLEVANPYQHEAINCLMLWFETNAMPGYFEQFSLFDLQRKQNRLTQIFSTSTVKGYLGKFTGRVDHTLTLRENSRGAFVFVIDGAFEVQNRLLESRDALALREVTAVEFEALSNNAMLLIIEF